MIETTYDIACLTHGIENVAEGSQRWGWESFLNQWAGGEPDRALASLKTLLAPVPQGCVTEFYFKGDRAFAACFRDKEGHGHFTVFTGEPGLLKTSSRFVLGPRQLKNPQGALRDFFKRMDETPLDGPRAAALASAIGNCAQSLQPARGMKALENPERLDPEIQHFASLFSQTSWALAQGDATALDRLREGTQTIESRPSRTQAGAVAFAERLVREADPEMPEKPTNVVPLRR